MVNRVWLRCCKGRASEPVASRGRGLPFTGWNMRGKWWIYLQERFPLFAHGPLIMAFSLSAMSYSALLRGSDVVKPAAAPVAFVTALLFFLQLRIADEFKDAEEDARYRPYRPVPRGLVTLRELGWLGIGAAIVQLAGSLWLKPRLVLLLCLAWVYLALMSKEFFVRQWLKRRPLVYMLSHMVVIPIFDLYATACDWLVAGVTPPAGLAWFLAASYFNGIVIELGRKIRAPADEEEGVETYSVLWGQRTALLAWNTAMAIAGLCAVRGAILIYFAGPVALTSGILLITAVCISFAFLHTPYLGRGRQIETFSGIWTLVLYMVLGVVPMVVRHLMS